MSKWTPRVFLGRDLNCDAQFQAGITYDDIVPWTGRVPSCYSGHPARRPTVAPEHRCGGCFAVEACKNPQNTWFSGREVFQRTFGKPLGETVVEVRYETIMIGGGEEP